MVITAIINNISFFLSCYFLYEHYFENKKMTNDVLTSMKLLFVAGLIMNAIILFNVFIK